MIADRVKVLRVTACLNLVTVSSRVKMLCLSDSQQPS